MDLVRVAESIDRAPSATTILAGQRPPLLQEAVWAFGLDLLATTVLWSVMSLYMAGGLYWLFEMGVYGWRYDDPERVYGPEAVQVRFLTIDAESVVQHSVDRLPDELSDRVIVAEEPIAVDGAEVAVVPDSFECRATNKGRALEWARRTLECDSEFVLYLDEDSHVMEFGGLPDADIVQFTEHPRRTSSLLTYLAEVNRIGFQIEQRAFPSIAVPLYAWGGGLAVRTSLEAEVTWNYPTVIEDTVFLWRSYVEADATFSYVLDRVSNQAPPSLWAMFRQRRRWIAGAREDNSILSLDRVLMYGIRDLSWSVTGLIPVLVVVSYVPLVDLFFFEIYRLVAFVLLAMLFLWVAIGVYVHRPRRWISVLCFLLAPITTVLHSAGALWGILSPPETFEVTTKIEQEPDELSQDP